MKPTRWLARGALAALLALALALALWALLGTSPISAVAWQPPPAPAAIPPNSALAKVEWFARELDGPEAVDVDPTGAVLTGTRDGKLWRVEPDDGGIALLAQVGGRPLALEYGPGGVLYLCESKSALMSLSPDGGLTTLATEEGGVPFKFTDDLTIAKDGTIYFTDASSRHSIDQFVDDLIEHQTSGRLLRYLPSTGTVTRVAAGFSFPNGVALGPTEEWLVLAETGTYRLWKIWVKGDKAGHKEPFGQPLVGFPDNVTFDERHGRFWVAIGSPRNGLMDALAGWPSVRNLIPRLPKLLRPKPARFAHVLAVDLEGRVVESLQYDAPDSYSPIASALRHGDWLYFGSFAAQGLGRLHLPPAPKSDH